jgi:mRNA interferase RelE/StbE
MNSTYEISFDPKALAELKKLDRTSQQRITSFLFENIQRTDKPRRLGKALTGGEIKLWRYRTDAFRVVCQMDDVEKIVRVLRVGHRKDVYR